MCAPYGFKTYRALGRDIATGLNSFSIGFISKGIPTWMIFVMDNAQLKIMEIKGNGPGTWIYSIRDDDSDSKTYQTR